MLVFDGNQKVYFHKDAHICLTPEANKKLLELFKKWTKCSSCDETKDSFVTYNRICGTCEEDLPQCHTDCYTKCFCRCKEKS